MGIEKRKTINKFISNQINALDIQILDINADIEKAHFDYNDSMDDLQRKFNEEKQIITNAHNVKINKLNDNLAHAIEEIRNMYEMIENKK